MTLRCDCGGALELTYQSYPDDPDATATEQYECVSCGRTGSYQFGGGVDQTSGCVTSVRDEGF